MIWRGLPCWQAQHLPLSVLVLSSGPRLYCRKIMTLSFGVLCMHRAFDTWLHLILRSCRLGAQHSCNYAMQVAMITLCFLAQPSFWLLCPTSRGLPFQFHSVTPFNLLRLDHQIIMRHHVWIWAVGYENWRIVSAFNWRATCRATVDKVWVFIPLNTLLSSLLSSYSIDSLFPSFNFRFVLSNFLIKLT